MTAHHTIGSARAETSGRTRIILAGAVALAALLLPFAARGMDTAPQQTAARAGPLLPLPPVRYLDSMRWMNWEPAAPLLKVDTLLLPDRAQPGKFRLPSDSERDLTHMS